MANVEQRVGTFLAKKWVFKEGNCSPMNMAKAGFICTAKNAVQCYYCDKELDEWEEDDDPWHEHRQHSNACPFVKKYDTPPDPNSLTILDVVQLEREKLLLKVNRKYEETKQNIERTFQETTSSLLVIAAKEKKRKNR